MDCANSIPPALPLRFVSRKRLSSPPTPSAKVVIAIVCQTKYFPISVALPVVSQLLHYTLQGESTAVSCDVGVFSALPLRFDFGSIANVRASRVFSAKLFASAVFEADLRFFKRPRKSVNPAQLNGQNTLSNLCYNGARKCQRCPNVTLSVQDAI